MKVARPVLRGPRRGNASGLPDNTAADHIAVTKAALAQLAGHRPGTRAGRKILIRADGAGGTYDFVNWLVSQRLSYSVGFSLPDTFAATLAAMPKHGWTPAYDAEGVVREGAWVADVVRHEAPWIRVEVEDLHRLVVAATGLELRAA